MGNAIAATGARALRTITLATAAWMGAAAVVSAPAPARASDHADGPTVDQDAASDLADLWVFLDPNDNSKLCVVVTVHGFIVPSEAGNLAFFDPNLLYQIQFDTTGKIKPDKTIDITFSPHLNPTEPQVATVLLPGQGKKRTKFTANVTAPTLAATANQQVVTSPANAPGVKFFAGECDDPFFFDIPAFNRFVASIKAGSPNPAVFSRARDSFAGYNILSIVIDIPVADIKTTSNVIGVAAATFRKTQSLNKNGSVKASGSYKQVDREANPGVNTVFLPLNMKDAYNAATPVDDVKGKFAPAIIATLQSLGTDQAHIQALADVVVTKGDYIHIDTTLANSGPQGGTNPGVDFPNGRRLTDDSIDKILTIVANGTPLGDNVSQNDVPFQDTFPFVPLPHQPLGNGVVDDLTRN